MRLELLFLVVAVQFLPGSAQVSFSRPTEGEVILGDVPFILTVAESTSAPFLSQMTNFSLLLLAGSYTSPTTLFAWDLSTINPSTVDNSVNIPSSMGTNARDAYFLGVRGSLLLDSTISVTYFSPIFTLQNMTGPSSLIPSVTMRTLTAATGTQTPIATPRPLARAIRCRDPRTGTETLAAIGDGSVDSLCERSAISILSVLATQKSTATTIPIPVTTLKPASGSRTSSIAPAIGITSPDTTTSTTTNSGAQATAGASTNTTGNEPTTSSKPSARIIYVIVIGGIALTTPVICLWLFLRYRKAHAPKPKSPSQESTSPFDLFGSFFSSLKGFTVLSKGSDKQPRMKRKHSDAEKGQALEVHVTRSLRFMSTRQSQPGTPVAETTVVQRRAFEEMYTRRESRRTILAELEGDSVVPDMPGAAGRPKYGRQSVGSEAGRWRAELDQAFDSYDAQRRSEALSARRDAESRSVTDRSSVATRRTVILSEGKQGRVVRGKDVANIITFTKRAAPPPLPALPVSARTSASTLKSASRHSVGHLPTVPQTAHLSGVPSPGDLPPSPSQIPTSRFLMRSASVSDLRSKARITGLDDEVFKREASVVVRGAEEERKERKARKERRERKRDELLRGGVGGSATIDVDVVRWVARGVEEDEQDGKDGKGGERSPRIGGQMTGT
ncbi:hypothetical protein BKA65DRAFT_551371 [Rhexocercosporidium sp. MPI-PUGE-AT-0058]|nr:hypothetical protein BKA65DRAFT_551371 [Rhexocercosporidium sp. MPI-PUGE-AT-0058]